MDNQSAQPQQTGPQSQTTLAQILDRANTKTVKLNKDVDYKTVVAAYLEVSSRGWAIKTQEVETSKLRSLLPLLEKYGFNPDAIYNKLVESEAGAYTIRMKFVRLKCLFDFCMETSVVTPGPNPFETYIRYTSPNKFKMSNVYKPKSVPMTFDEVKLTISSMTDPVKFTLEFLLKTGLRIGELNALEQSADGSWFVKGKGGKFRTILASPPAEISSRSKIQTALAKLGLTPHQLRKLVATKLIDSKIDINELTQVMGWSSISTAQIYLQKSSINKLKEKIGDIL